MVHFFSPIAPTFRKGGEITFNLPYEISFHWYPLASDPRQAIEDLESQMELWHPDKLALVRRQLSEAIFQLAYEALKILTEAEMLDHATPPVQVETPKESRLIGG